MEELLQDSTQHKGDHGKADKNELEDPAGQNVNMHHQAPFTRSAQDPAFNKNFVKGSHTSSGTLDIGAATAKGKSKLHCWRRCDNRHAPGTKAMKDCKDACDMEELLQDSTQHSPTTPAAGQPSPAYRGGAGVGDGGFGKPVTTVAGKPSPAYPGGDGVGDGGFGTKNAEALVQWNKKGDHGKADKKELEDPAGEKENMHHQPPFKHSAQDPVFNKNNKKHSHSGVTAAVGALTRKADAKVDCWNSCDMKHAHGSKGMKACKQACHLAEFDELLQLEDPAGENEDIASEDDVVEFED